LKQIEFENFIFFDRGNPRSFCVKVVMMKTQMNKCTWNTIEAPNSTFLSVGVFVSFVVVSQEILVGMTGYAGVIILVWFVAASENLMNWATGYAGVIIV